MNGCAGVSRESSFHRLGLLTGIGRCLASLAVYVGAMAVVIQASHWLTNPSTWRDYPFLTPWFLAWWVLFPLASGVWMRSWLWSPVAWLGPLLLHPFAPNLMGEQAAAFFAFGAFVTALGGTIIGKWRHRRT